MAFYTYGDAYRLLGIKMTPEEINRKVAERLGVRPIDMEFSDQWPPDYCRDIGAAFEITNRFSYFCLVKPRNQEQWKCDLGKQGEIVVVWADTAPMAIALAFLRLDEK